MKRLPPRVIISLIIGGAVLIVGALAAYSLNRKPTVEDQTDITAPPKPVNLIPIKDRPYITLKPLVGRNEIEITIHDLKIPADSVEVTLEYDRNKGVLDAVLREFKLDKLPFSQMLFMGSESAGGHITYHDDVIGGTLHLEFEGEEPYALEVPWRYDDSQPKYSLLSTTDGRFQVELEDPYIAKKVVVMQSPGLPEAIDGEIIAGPYLFRGDIGLPTSTTNQVKIRLNEETANTRMLGFDGEVWQPIEYTQEGKTLIATNKPIYQTYIIVQ